MAQPSTDPPLNLDAFWRVFTKLVAGLMRQHAHAEITLTFQQGTIQLVRVNRSYRPKDLPDL